MVINKNTIKFLGILEEINNVAILPRKDWRLNPPIFYKENNLKPYNSFFKSTSLINPSVQTNLFPLSPNLEKSDSKLYPYS